MPNQAFAKEEASLSWVEVRGPTQLRVGEEARFDCLPFLEKGGLAKDATIRFEKRLVLPRKDNNGASKVNATQRGTTWSVRFSKPSLWEIHCVAVRGKQTLRSLMPLSVEVSPHIAQRLSLHLLPKRQWYRRGEVIQVQAQVTDATGFVHRVPSVVWRSSEPSHLPDAIGQIRLSRAGRFWLEASIVKTRLHQRIQYAVDAKPPEVELAFPTKHAMVTGKATIVLRGKVVDLESGLASFSLQDHAVRVEKDGSFAVPYTCRWGLNLLSFVAKDRAGHLRRFQRSFLYAPRYLGREEALSVFHPLLSLRIAQAFLDRGSLDARSDILTLLEDVIHATDLGKIRIKPIRGTYRVPPIGPTIRYRVVQRDAMQLERIRASLRLFRDGFWLTLSLRRFVFPLDVFLNDDRQRITVDARRVRFSLWFQVRQAPNGRVFVSMPYRHADLSGLRIEGIHGLLSWFRGTVEQRVRDGLRDGLLGAIQERLIPSLQRKLTRFPLEIAWKLPPVLGEQPLRMRVDVRHLALTPKAFSVALGTAVQCEEPRFPKVRGMPLLPSRPGPLPHAAFSSAISVDALNQVLYALWQCGVFQRDISKILATRLKLPKLPFALPQLKLRFDAQLPPLLVPGDDRYPFAFALGGFRVRLDWSEKGAPPSSLHAEVGLVVGARVSTNAAGELLVILAPRPLRFQLQILQQSGTRSLSHEDWAAFLSGLVLEQMPDAAVAIFRSLPLHQEDPFLAIPSAYRAIFRAVRLWPRQIGFDGQRLRVDLDLLYKSPSQTFRTND
ncbi:MAG: hypothetical protein H6727_12705 [Myxococcales bacterium]|nr:hypothetical protein [Myxococcales bacterium]